MRATDIGANEYDAFYANYIKVLDDIELMKAMEEGANQFSKLLEALPEGKMLYAYAPGKWTIAEVVLHVIDAERVFQYRLLRIARGDQTNMPGFEENDYVPASKANLRSRESLLKELKAVRASSIELVKSFDEEAFSSKGFVMNNPFTARAIAFIICGHMKHHVNVIEDRYLKYKGA
ncbi:DinB family protein [Zhouia amylolytica]|uniref:DinB family protein n=1 Tax=Zhouia amylolytica TaxID=376730 RepID=UPI0020CF8D6B|nr:DinB family protein [Zhouia amylolytica]MCQ0110766.1 DinB family protein [Zhouia amylolytica]